MRETFRDLIFIFVAEFRVVIFLRGREDGFVNEGVDGAEVIEVGEGEGVVADGGLVGEVFC